MPGGLISKIWAELFLLFLLSATIAKTQQLTLPHNSMPPKDEIELNAILMESTFMIQGQSEQGPTLGTVFIVARPIPNTMPTRGYFVLVTAAHVLEEMVGDTATLNLRRRVDQGKNTWVQVPYPLKIRTNGQPNWKRNPQADVAVMYIIPLPDSPLNLIKPISSDMLADDKMLTDYDVKPGDELRCLGYPLGVASNDAGFPVLRSGRIASYPLLPTESTKTFLLDFRVFKGNSGGPVYFVELMRPKPPAFEFMSYHFVMGLVSDEVLFTEQSGGPYSSQMHQTQLGLAKVVHASLIKQTIDMLPPTP